MKSPTYNNMMLSDQIAQHAVTRTFKRAADYNASIVQVVKSRINRNHDFGNDRAVDLDAPTAY